MIMKKQLFYAALAIMTMASCTSNDYVGDQEKLEAGISRPISFNFDMPVPTRSSSEDAGKLNNQFIVWGEKNENQSAAGTTPSDGNLVFPNYIVNYIDNSAVTSTSNTNGWEYVGYKFDDTNTENYSTNVSPNTKPGTGDMPAQTIKYWDDNASSYTFTAISALPADISAGRVKIEKTESGDNVYAKGYTLTLAKTEGESTVYPSLTGLYFADRVYIANNAGYTHTAVQFDFRNSLSHIRAGIYETVPGYNISAIKFYVNTSGENPPQTEEAKVNDTSAFGAVCDNSTPDNFEGTINVTYYSTGTDINKPILSVTPSNDVQKSNLILGTNLSLISTSSLLKETANDPSWDKASGDYTSVLPQATNNPLKLKCDYTLYNSITKETINITEKTAEIPAQYLQWKANYKYSYIFKITDDNLNPITFDAVVVTNEMGNAEYITIVTEPTEPSITTFGVKDDKYVTGKNEYETGSDIYATFMKGSTVLTPSLTETTKANYVRIYYVTSSDPTNFPITETSVAERLATSPTGTPKLTCTNISTDATTYFTAAPRGVESVPSEDGTTKSINALILQGVKTAGKYAVELITYDEGTQLTTGTSLDGYFTLSGEVYSTASGTADGTTKYYKQVKTYKVITVVAP